MKPNTLSSTSLSALRLHLKFILDFCAEKLDAMLKGLALLKQKEQALVICSLFKVVD